MNDRKRIKRMGKTKQYFKEKTIIIAAVLACIAITAVAVIKINTFSADSYEVNLEDMFGRMLMNDEGCRYIDNGDSGWALYGPYLVLDKGYYTVDIDYQTDKTTTMDVHSQVFSDYLVSNDIVLSAAGTHKSFQIRLKDKIDDFDIRVKYNGEGHLEINHIQITENMVGIQKKAFLAYFVVLFFTGCYLFRRKLEKYKITIVMIIAVAILSCVPEMTKGMCTGDDGTFHLLRIEGIAQGLRAGEFPVRMQPNWMDGYGYPVSIYYGDILLYIPAFLRMAGFSTTQAYKIYLFLISLGTSLTAYTCFNKIVKDSRAALFGTAGYVFATYRLTNIYVRLAVGEYSTMMFLPIVLLALYRIYTEDVTEFQRYAKNALLLAAGMTGIIQTHLISVLMAVLIIAMVCIIMVKKTLRRNTMIVYVLAVVLTVAFNLFFLVPFMDCARNEPIQVFLDGEDAVIELIQERGAYIGQYFMLYQNAFGGKPGNGIGGRKAFTPGVLLILVLLIAIYYNIKHHNKTIKFITVMSVLTLWMASNVFPWNFMIQHVPLMRWVCQMQYPWRFLTIAQLFLSLLLSMLLTNIKGEDRAHLERVCFTVLVVTTTLMFSGVIQEQSYYEIYDATGIDSYAVGNGEYIRIGTDLELFDGKVNANNVDIIEDYTKKGKYAIMKCQSTDMGDDAWVEFPIMNYKNYVAYGEDGTSFPIVDGDNNVIRVMLPKHYSGSVAVAYEIPLLYRVADICSLIAVIGAGAVIFFIKQKENLVKEKW